jgi:hypothetical protein
MDLWATLGIPPQVGLLVALAGAVTAIVVARTLVYHRSRAEKRNLGLLKDR